jgi:hypothetical protein
MSVSAAKALEKPVFNKVLQIAVVVGSCDKAVRKYADVYGIGPWNIYEFNPDTVSDMIIRGNPRRACGLRHASGSVRHRRRAVGVD